MKTLAIVLFLFIGINSIQSFEGNLIAVAQIKEQDMTPKYLYKILSTDNWNTSQKNDSLKLTDADRDFIHLSREDQLNKIIEKYWADNPEFVVVKIYTENLPGKLIYEANPGGTNKYYHLYDGSIPLTAVVESKIVKR